MGADTYTLFSEKEGGPNRRDGHFGGKCGILDMQDFLIRRVEIQRLQRQNCPQPPVFFAAEMRGLRLHAYHTPVSCRRASGFLSRRGIAARARGSILPRRKSAPAAGGAHAYTPPVRR